MVRHDEVMLKTTASDAFFRRFCKNPCGMYDLGEMYAVLNARHFGGELAVLNKVVTVDKNGEEWENYPRQLIWNKRFKKKYGTYTYASRMIQIAGFAAWDSNQVWSTLLHEMLHKYLHQKGMDDGIEGHGPNFINYSADINADCLEKGYKYRINFFDEEIVLKNPNYSSVVHEMEFHVANDLDIGRKCKSVIKAAFDEQFSYNQ
jgi:hypothetical protein